MKNNIKLLLLSSILYFNSIQAMGSLRNRLVSFARATTKAQNFKPSLHPKNFNFKPAPQVKFSGSKNNDHRFNGSSTYRHALPALGLGMLYVAYDQTKSESQTAPELTQENIEKYPQYKDHFIQYALEHGAEQEIIQALIQKYPECAEAVVAKYYLNIILDIEKNEVIEDFLHDVFEDMNQIDPNLIEIAIERWPQYKDPFIQYALERELPSPSILKTLIRKYPEYAEAISTKQYHLIFGADQKPHISEMVAQDLESEAQGFDWSKVTDKNMQTLFDDLKAKMGLPHEVSLFATANPEIASDAISICLHNIVLVYSQSKLPNHLWKFILAHELTHILKKHNAHYYFIDENTSEKLSARRKTEYEADEGAVVTLGSISEAMEVFHAIPDASHASGWKLPKDEDDSHSTHPSDANRCRALLALVEKYPDKFQKKN